MSSQIKVVAYSEQCAMQGRAVSVSKIEEYGEDSHDFAVYEGTGEELLEIANEFDPPIGYRGHYRFQLAKTIREAVYWERPDLKPQPEIEDEE